MAGPLAADVAAMLEVVGYLTREPDPATGRARRVLHLRDRYGRPLGDGVPDTLPDPTLGRLLDILRLG